MSVYIYGKEGCKKCASAEKKIRDIFKLEYRKVDLENVNPPPEDWREIGMSAAMALYSMSETLPIIGIVIDGSINVFDYPAAMRILKGKGKAI